MRDYVCGVKMPLVRLFGGFGVGVGGGEGYRDAHSSCTQIKTKYCHAVIDNCDRRMRYV